MLVRCGYFMAGMAWPIALHEAGQLRLLGDPWWYYLMFIFSIVALDAIHAWNSH